LVTLVALRWLPPVGLWLPACVPGWRARLHKLVAILGVVLFHLLFVGFRF
jgi:hypothetical protein